LSEQKLLDALPPREVKVSDLARQFNTTKDIVLDVAHRLERKGCVKVRKPFLREARVLKTSDRYVEATKVIAVMNLKGGVGKTVTSLNLAVALADAGFKTLLVDMDPQANATSALGVKAKTTVYSVLVGTRAPSKAVHRTGVENLSIMPSELALAGAEVEVVGVDAAYRMWEVLEWVKDDYKYVVIDCPPSVSMLSINALAASNSVLIPVQCGQFAMESLEKMMETVSVMRRINEDLHVEGILPTLYDSHDKLSCEVLEKVRGKYGALMFNAAVPRDPAVSEAAKTGGILIRQMPDSEAAKSYVKLTKEVASGGR